MKRYVKSSYSYDLFNDQVTYYEQSNYSLDSIWDRIFNEFGDEDLANDVVAEVEAYREDGF